MSLNKEELLDLIGTDKQVVIRDPERTEIHEGKVTKFYQQCDNKLVFKITKGPLSYDYEIGGDCSAYLKHNIISCKDSLDCFHELNKDKPAEDIIFGRRSITTGSLKNGSFAYRLFLNYPEYLGLYSKVTFKVNKLNRLTSISYSNAEGKLSGWDSIILHSLFHVLIKGK